MAPIDGRDGTQRSDRATNVIKLSPPSRRASRGSLDRVCDSAPLSDSTNYRLVARSGRVASRARAITFTSKRSIVTDVSVLFLIRQSSHD